MRYHTAQLLLFLNLSEPYEVSMQLLKLQEFPESLLSEMLTIICFLPICTLSKEHKALGTPV